MRRRRRTPFLLSYLISLVVAIALLVSWVIYVVSSASRIEELGRRLGVSTGTSTPWVVLAVGCVLFVLLIVGLTLQFAQVIAERRYAQKQEELVSNVSHEMKSPLAAIKLHAQTLRQHELTAAERERSQRVILEQVERMTALVDDVLESSRLGARRQAFELAPLALAPFLARHLEDAAPRLASRDVRLTAVGETQAIVLANPEALRRVLDNLLDNAARFSHPGGEVRCRVGDHLRTVTLAVEDDGVGIPEDALAKIFDRFYQVRRDDEPHRQGTGLGLAIVADLVRAMKGKIEASSGGRQAGARFVVTLPRTREVAPREASA